MTTVTKISRNSPDSSDSWDTKNGSRKSGSRLLSVKFNFYSTPFYLFSVFILLLMFTACAIMIATTANDINTIIIIILSFNAGLSRSHPRFMFVCYPKSFYLSTFFLSSAKVDKNYCARKQTSGLLPFIPTFVDLSQSAWCESSYKPHPPLYIIRYKGEDIRWGGWGG